MSIIFPVLSFQVKFYYEFVSAAHVILFTLLVMVGRTFVQANFYLVKSVNFFTTGDNLKQFHVPRSSIFAVYCCSTNQLSSFFHVHTVSQEATWTKIKSPVQYVHIYQTFHLNFINLSCIRHKSGLCYSCLSQ